MLRKTMVLLTAFVFMVVFCSPMATYGEEVLGRPTEDEFPVSQENFDHSAIPQAQTVDDLIRRLEEADGRIPADFSSEDMSMFLKQADPDVVDRIMDKIFANATPVSADGYEYDERSVPERADFYRSYDCITGKEEVLPFDTSCSTTEILESEGEYFGNDTSPTGN